MYRNYQLRDPDPSGNTLLITRPRPVGGIHYYLFLFLPMDFSQTIDNILTHEIYFHFAKSWWHGGQNVNKRETKAELYFNVHDSHSLTDAQKRRLVQVAWHMIHHNEWILIMTDQEERLQVANKEKVIHHFRELLNHILPEPKERKGSQVPAWVIAQRKEAKQYRSEIKKSRTLPKIFE